MDCYNNTIEEWILILTILKADKSKCKVLANQVPSENQLPNLQTVPFSLCLHMAKRRGGEEVKEGEERGLYSSLSYGYTNPIMGARPS